MQELEAILMEIGRLVSQFWHLAEIWFEGLDKQNYLIGLMVLFGFCILTLWIRQSYIRKIFITHFKKMEYLSHQDSNLTELWIAVDRLDRTCQDIESDHQKLWHAFDKFRTQLMEENRLAHGEKNSKQIKAINLRLADLDQQLNALSSQADIGSNTTIQIAKAKLKEIDQGLKGLNELTGSVKTILQHLQAVPIQKSTLKSTLLSEVVARLDHNPSRAEMDYLKQELTLTQDSLQSEQKALGEALSRFVALEKISSAGAITYSNANANPKEL